MPKLFAASISRGCFSLDILFYRTKRGTATVACLFRDPEQFSDPNSLDIARRNTGHLALGGGPHSCVGALLLRMAAISATRAFTDRLAGAELVDPVVWRRGSALGSPYSLRVRYGPLESSANRMITRSRAAS
jgi:cytochrome P450